MYEINVMLTFHYDDTDDDDDDDDEYRNSLKYTVGQVEYRN